MKDGTKKQGFATLTAEQRREISSRGGKAAHAKGTGHKWTPEEAREAGKLGGAKVAADRERMKEMGRRGGIAAHANDGKEETTTP